MKYILNRKISLGKNRSLKQVFTYLLQCNKKKKKKGILNLNRNFLLLSSNLKVFLLKYLDFFYLYWLQNIYSDDIRLVSWTLCGLNDCKICVINRYKYLLPRNELVYSTTYFNLKLVLKFDLFVFLTFFFSATFKVVTYKYFFFVWQVWRLGEFWSDF